MTTTSTTAASQRPIRLFRNKAAKIAAIPMILTALVVFIGGTIWTIVFSFTKSRLLPSADFVGLTSTNASGRAPNG
jgi:glucose/mannose transport system permease protein